MKKLFVLIAITSAISVSAQEQRETPAFRSSTVLKWNPASLAFGKISLGSEFHLWNRKGITFNLGLPVKQEQTFEIDGDNRTLSLKSTSVMGGYRMYLGKADITGFYFEPYVKYVKNESMIDDYTATIGGRSARFEASSDYSGIGVGLQLGAQFTIAKLIVVDMFLLGPEANSSKETVSFTEVGNVLPWSSIEANDAKREIEDAVKDIPIIGKKVDVTVNPNAKTVAGSYKGFLPGIRAGVSVGIRF